MLSSKYEGKSAVFQKSVFVFKLILGCLPLLVFYCYARFYADGYMDGEWPMYKQVKSYINGTGRHNDFLILGDSTPKFNLNAKALSSDECSVQNIALGGSTPIECYYVLKEYLENGNTVNVLIAAWAPFHFWHCDCFTTRYEYFHELWASDLFHIYKTASQYKENKHIRDTFFAEYPLTKILRAIVFYPSKYLPAMQNARFVNRHKMNIDAFKFYEETHGSNFCGDGIHPDSAYAGMPDFNANPLMTLYLQKLLAMCRQHNIQIIIEQSPLPFVSKEKLMESFEREYFDYFQSFKAEFPEMQIPLRFSFYDNNYFIDSHHMNNNGNAAWTQYIKEKYINPYIQDKNNLEEIK